MNAYVILPRKKGPLTYSPTHPPIHKHPLDVSGGNLSMDAALNMVFAYIGNQNNHSKSSKGFSLFALSYGGFYINFQKFVQY